jgi:hypothetical protein
MHAKNLFASNAVEIFKNLQKYTAAWDYYSQNIYTLQTFDYSVVLQNRKPSMPTSAGLKSTQYHI